VKHRTPQGILELLNDQEFILNRKLADILDAYMVIRAFKNNINDGRNAAHGEIRIEQMQNDEHLTLGPDTNFAYDDTFYEEFISFCSFARESGINLTYPVGGYHRDIEGFIKSPGRPHKFFSTDHRGNAVRPAGLYMAAYCKGYYGEVESLPDSMIAYAKERGLEFTGPVYISYVLDEISTVRPEDYVARCIVSVKESGNP
jgi:hypothetical protein